MDCNLNIEIKMRNSSHLTGELLEILTGDRNGTNFEKKRLLRLTSRLKEKIFIEAVFLLTHKYIRNSEIAHQMFNKILEHRDGMIKALGRDVSIQVAALDYFQNIRKVLKKPVIIEARQYNEYTKRAALDKTTRTFDRDMLDPDIDAEIEKANRFGTIFSLLFIDLDNLKMINDTWGHETGTRAIKHVVDCTRRKIRKYDTIYRYGGDEFVVLLPNSAIIQAFNTARRILNYLHDTGLGDLPVSPTISIGISSFDNTAVKTREHLLSFADKALYQAKREGGNMIRVYGFSDKEDESEDKGKVKNLT